MWFAAVQAETGELVRCVGRSVLLSALPRFVLFFRRNWIPACQESVPVRQKSERIFFSLCNRVNALPAVVGWQTTGGREGVRGSGWLMLCKWEWPWRLGQRQRVWLDACNLDRSYSQTLTAASVTWLLYRVISSGVCYPGGSKTLAGLSTEEEIEKRWAQVLFFRKLCVCVCVKISGKWVAAQTSEKFWAVLTNSASFMQINLTTLENIQMDVELMTVSRAELDMISLA